MFLSENLLTFKQWSKPFFLLERWLNTKCLHLPRDETVAVVTKNGHIIKTLWKTNYEMWLVMELLSFNEGDTEAGSECSVFFYILYQLGANWA